MGTPRVPHSALQQVEMTRFCGVSSIPNGGLLVKGIDFQLLVICCAKIRPCTLVNERYGTLEVEFNDFIS